MIAVEWSPLAEQDLERVLLHPASPAGARTSERRIKVAEKTISIFPHSAPFNGKHGWYEAVVTKVPLILLYRLEKHGATERAIIVAVFNTSRDPGSMPRR
jgi:plasmid stabilization system protein ParE